MRVKTDIAVFVGRFQVPELHPGQLEILQDLLDNYDKVVVALGIAPTLGTKPNPMDYATREVMIKGFCNKIIVLPIYDNQSDETWSQELDNSLHRVFQIGDIMLFGGRDSFKEHYSGVYPITEVETKAPHSGVAIRTAIGKKVIPSIDFRKGQIYSTQNQRPRIFPTVDIALMRTPTENNNIKRVQILLARKSGCKCWRLPGGFVDPTDSSYLSAAKRELSEETGIICDRFTYIGSALIDDWRYKEDKIMTTLFQADYDFGVAKAADDIEEVHWFDAEDIACVDISPEHKVLINMIPCVQDEIKKGIKRGY